MKQSENHPLSLFMDFPIFELYWFFYLRFSFAKNLHLRFMKRIKTPKSKVKNNCRKSIKEASHLSVSTRSQGDNPLGSSFALGNNITGIPLFLAYCAPPHSGITRNKNKF